MPTRRHLFVTGKSYHLYDKTLDHARVFDNAHCCKAFVDALQYYRFNVPHSLSHFKKFSDFDKRYIHKLYMREKDSLVHIECFTLMPNHYHLLIRQKKEGGIHRFMSNTLNSFTHYYNRLENRKGPIFLPQFRSVEILSTRQYLYTSKYIHRNPLQSNLVSSLPELLYYKYSSLSSYILPSADVSWIKTSKLLKHFGGSRDAYWQYIQ